MQDKVPALVATGALAVAPVLPGPTKDEWAAAAFGFAALLIRELVFWFRNRK